MIFTRKFNKKRTRNKKLYKKRSRNKFTRNKNKKYGGVGSDETGATSNPDISELHISGTPHTGIPHTGSTIQYLNDVTPAIITLKDLIKNRDGSLEHTNSVITNSKLVFNPNHMQTYINLLDMNQL